jgi:hypothetical protein
VERVDVQQPTTSRPAAPVPVLDDTAPPPLAWKVPQSLEKSRKFVSMHKMHQENLAVLKSIDNHIPALVHGVVDLAAAIRERPPNYNDNYRSSTKVQDMAIIKWTYNNSLIKSVYM